MPSPSSGPLTAFFMFVPLVAVPALAIFGVPEFKQASALIEHTDSHPSLGNAGEADEMLESSTDDLISPVRNDITRLEGKGSASDNEQGAIKQAVNGRSRASSNRGMSDADSADSEDWSPPPHVLNEWDPSPDEGKQALAAKDKDAHGEHAAETKSGEKSSTHLAANDTDDSPFRPLDESADSKETAHDNSKEKEKANPFEEHDRARKRQNESSETAAAKGDEAENSLTWKSAVKRLHALGIHSYQLQPGDKANEFHFSCSYAAPSQPRVTRRFEAEAAEPLQAVRQVIAQVESMSGK